MKSAFLFSGIAIVALVAACGGNSVAPAPRPSVDGGDRNDATSGAPSSTDSSTDEGADTALGPDGPDTTCGPDSVARIAVGSGTVGSPFDPLGYAPYAIDGCTLAYVTPSVQGQTSG
jgi:hypothetical protein